MRFKLTVIGIGLLALGSAWAGKPERERAKELDKLARAASGAIKKACGCATAIAGNWKSFPDVNKMFRCHDTVDAIKTAATGHCTDAASKKAYCAGVTRFTIGFTADRYAQPARSGKTVSTFCTDMKYTNAEELKTVLDKL